MKRKFGKLPEATSFEVFAIIALTGAMLAADAPFIAYMPLLVLLAVYFLISWLMAPQPEPVPVKVVSRNRRVTRRRRV
jgi:hypothetical protein